MGGWVYIMTNKRNGTLYVGVTADVRRRAFEHREEMTDGFTKRYGLGRLVHAEWHDDIRDAIHREKRIKHWSRRQKLALVESANPEWDNLYHTLGCGGKVTAHGVDIRDAAAVDAMIESAFKDGPLTDLINNAAGNFISRTQDLSPRGFDAVANIVMHGTFYVTHAVGRRWIAGGHRGNVVSITVTWVRNGSPYVVPSAMSKSAIHAMTMSLATEWGRYGIRLNTIAPGEIPTEGMSKRIKPGDEAGARTIAMNPMGRVGQMSELENLATFLISGGCDWINGETIAMDGAQALAMGGNFYQLRDWTDADWKAARDAIVAQNEKDKAKRS